MLILMMFLMRSSVDITPNADMHTFIIMNNDH